MRAWLVVLTAGAIAGSAGCTSKDGAECAVVSSIGLAQQSDAGMVTATSPSPSELDINFGGVAIGHSVTKAIQVQYMGARPDFSVPIPGPDPEFAADQGEAKPPDPGLDELNITFQPYRVGDVSSQFTIDLLQPEGCPGSARSLIDQVTVNLTGTGLSCSETISPNVLDFGVTPTGTTVTKTITITTTCAPIDGLTTTILGRDASLFKVLNPPSSLAPDTSIEVNVSYSPTELEDRSLASVLFSGSDGEKASVELFGEPTDKDDGGFACLPGGDYCCADEATLVAVGQSDQSLCRTCTIDGGVASWSLWPVGTTCTNTGYGDGGSAGACAAFAISPDSEFCSCSVSSPEGVALCGRGSTVDVDSGVFPCCFGRCMLDAGATVGICPCFPFEDGGSCP